MDMYMERNGPLAFLNDLANVFEQLRRDQLGSQDKNNFDFITRTGKVARLQGIPDTAEQQLTLLRKLSRQAGFDVASSKTISTGRLCIEIRVTDGDLLITEYNKFADGKARNAEHFKPQNKLMADMKFRAMLDEQSSQTTKLQFYESGKASFGGPPVRLRKGSKIYALLLFLSQEKNTPFKVSEIKEKVNAVITSPSDYVKAYKDVYDSIYNFRKRLGVKKGQYFPISFDEKRITWHR